MDKIGAIICELNPIHFGHKYLVEQAKKSGITHLVGIISSNFVQRGEPSIISKQTRAKIALECGFDLIVEIPSIWSMSTAERFAKSGVHIANGLGCIDTLIFGSECGNLDILDKISSTVLSSLFSEIIKSHIKKGITFAKARELSIKDILGDKFAEILRLPNNILAIEYIKAIKSSNSLIKPFTIARKGVYHDNNFAIGKLCSSSYIRKLMIERNNKWINYVPLQIFDLINHDFNNDLAPVTINLMERAILFKLRSTQKQNILTVPDISEGLENRIIRATANADSLNDLIAKIKTKRYAESRIRRIIMCIFLGISNLDQMSSVPYIKVLGSNKKGLDILKIAKKTAKLPIISRSCDYNKLSLHAKSIFDKECKIDDIYGLMSPKIAPLGYSKRAKFILRKE